VLHQLKRSVNGSEIGLSNQNLFSKQAYVCICV
jgi:hypothetical protein